MSAEALPFDDWPTGPIDFYDPADPVVAELAKEDAHGNLHDARGRFTNKPVHYLHLVERPDVPGVDRPYTAEELDELWPDGPHVTVWDWPTDPSEQVVKEAGGAVLIGLGGAASTCTVQVDHLEGGATRITYGGGQVAIVLPGKDLDPARVLHHGDPGYHRYLAAPTVDPEQVRFTASAAAGVAARCTASLDSGPDAGTRCQVNTTWRKPNDPTTPVCHHHEGVKPK